MALITLQIIVTNFTLDAGEVFAQFAGHVKELTSTGQCTCGLQGRHHLHCLALSVPSPECSVQDRAIVCTGLVGYVDIRRILDPEIKQRQYGSI